MNSFEQIVCFNSDDYGFSDIETGSFFHGSVDTYFLIKERREVKGIIDLLKHDPFFVSRDELIETTTPSTPATPVASIIVDEIETMILPEIVIVSISRKTTPRFEF